MFAKIIGLEIKSFIRSASLERDLSIKIFLGVFGIYLAVMMFILGITLHPILQKQFPDSKPMFIVNKFIFIWFIFDFVIRFMMQKIPVLNIKPLLIQNIKRSAIVDFILCKSIFSFFNLLTPLLITPFVFLNFKTNDFTTIGLIGWLINMYSIGLIMSFLNILFQKKIMNNTRLFVAFLVLIAVFSGLEYLAVFSITDLFGKLFNLILYYPILCLISIGILIVLYSVNKKNLMSNFYLDNYLKTDSQSYSENNFSWVHRFGEVAPFMQLDLKLIWRNKRPKSILYMCLFFAFYGLIFYQNDNFKDSAMLAFVGVFMTGIFAINFGQFIPAWDSSYYPLMMTQNIPMKLYLKSKATLMYFSIGIMTVLTSFYAYFGYDILLLNIACAIYNIGINVPLILRFGANNRKRIDLGKSQFMNYQGTGAAQYLLAIPLVLAPCLIWFIFKFIFSFTIAISVLAIIGIIGFFMKNYFYKSIIKSYQLRKYQALYGFKEDNI